MVKKDGMILEKSALRAVTSSLFGQERGLVRDVDSSLEGGTRWFEKTYAIYTVINSLSISYRFS